MDIIEHLRIQSVIPGNFFFLKMSSYSFMGIGTLGTQKKEIKFSCVRFSNYSSYYSSFIFQSQYMTEIVNSLHSRTGKLIHIFCFCACHIARIFLVFGLICNSCWLDLTGFYAMTMGIDLPHTTVPEKAIKGEVCLQSYLKTLLHTH